MACGLVAVTKQLRRGTVKTTISECFCKWLHSELIVFFIKFERMETNLTVSYLLYIGILHRVIFHKNRDNNKKKQINGVRLRWN